VGRIQLSFIQWCGDALGIQVPTLKSDAAGLMSYMKLCYANCLYFTSCVVTALSARICAGLQDAQFLFGTGVGEAQHVVTRMRAALAELVFLLPETADAVLQVKQRSLLTMHMPKKSGIKHCNSCGITGMNTAIHLRADHKMGPYDLASDCDGVLGRVLADLKPFDLPPPQHRKRLRNERFQNVLFFMFPVARFQSKTNEKLICLLEHLSIDVFKLRLGLYGWNPRIHQAPVCDMCQNERF
jgi:hypothetical protein